MSTPPPKRSRNGCWTCKRRRRKCDETHPTCTTCHDNSLVCEGYEPRLRWDVGVASRGYLTGASLPTIENAPPRQKGRQRDLLRQEKKHVDGSPLTDSPALDHVFQSPEGSASVSTSSNPSNTPTFVLDSLSLRDMQKETLLQEFLNSGIKRLVAADGDAASQLPIVALLKQGSEVLQNVCVAYQAYLSHGANSLFYELYSDALSEFRASIDHPLMNTDAGILSAGLLLCTIGILQGTPWTIHIKGMERLLDERANLSPLADPDPALTQAIEVMGIFDLRAFVIGRQTPSLNVWRRYRLGQLIHSIPEVDSIEPVSGIPRSIIDILALEDDESTEELLWSWPGCVGTLLQCQLWDAHRYAMMLHVRRRKKVTMVDRPSLQTSRSMLPSHEVLLIKALSALDAIYNGIKQPPTADSFILNALLYPLFLVGIEVFTANDKERQQIVTRGYSQALADDPFVNARQSWEILQTIALSHEEGRSVTADEVAHSQGIEVALL